MTGLRVLVVGGGMFVTGRGTETSGTLVPALLEGAKIGLTHVIGLGSACGIHILEKVN